MILYSGNKPFSFRIGTDESYHATQDVYAEFTSAKVGKYARLVLYKDQFSGGETRQYRAGIYDDISIPGGWAKVQVLRFDADFGLALELRDLTSHDPKDGAFILGATGWGLPMVQVPSSQFRNSVLQSTFGSNTITVQISMRPETSSKFWYLGDISLKWDSTKREIEILKIPENFPKGLLIKKADRTTLAFISRNGSDFLPPYIESDETIVVAEGIVLAEPEFLVRVRAVTSDGSPISTNLTEELFAVPGNYPITLTATNNNGSTHKRVLLDVTANTRSIKVVKDHVVATRAVNVYITVNAGAAHS